MENTDIFKKTMCVEQNYNYRRFVARYQTRNKQQIIHF